MLLPMTIHSNDPDQLAAIRAEAEAVSARYPSLDPEALLPRLCTDERISLCEGDLYDIAGVLRCLEGTWEIRLNRQDSEARRRLTLAHLLGHYFLHAATGRTFVEGRLVARQMAAD